MIIGLKSWLTNHKSEFGHFIDGGWVHPDNREILKSYNPCNQNLLATTLQGTQEDVDLAVSSAKKAYSTWSTLSNYMRAKHLYNLARHLQKNQRLLTVLESLDNGKSFRESRDCDIPTVIRCLYHYAGWAQLMDEEITNWKSLGVVAAIIPWNFPLMLLAWKVCPALAVGNTVVLKPASLTRLSALLFAEICSEAGLPPGVINVVTGDGELGSILATHIDVSKVAFTGSTEVGKTLRQKTAGLGKKLSLELGGKSPMIVFESADIDSAIEGVVDAIWFNQGQVCSAGSKLLVQESISEKFINKLKERMKTLRLGDSLDKSIDMGPLIDKQQKSMVMEFVNNAKKDGAEIFQVTPTSSLGDYHFLPTLITKVSPASEIVIKEVFGPVLVAMTFRTAKEAIALANNTIYGLASSVWTENITLALEVAYQIKAGTVWINCHNMFDASSGFGGFKQSGFGRDGGKEGLFEYIKLKDEPIFAFSNTDIIVNYEKFGKLVSLPQVPGNSNHVESSECPRIDRTYKLYYGGIQKRPDSGYYISVANHTNSECVHMPSGNGKDIRNAVECALKAQAGWAQRSGHNRAQILYYIAENLDTHRDKFLEILTNFCGKDKTESRQEFDESIERLFYWAAYCDKYGGSVQETTLYGTVFKLNDAMGVIGIACPDNYPLLAFISLFAPAIARGNTVVIIPSQVYPVLALNMYQIFETSDLPNGVVNIITGERDHLTKFLSEHQDVQAMWYFGTKEGSKFVEYISACNLKRTWVNYGKIRDWKISLHGQTEEFLYHATQCKNIWIPFGDIFAN